jgi:epsilon-lactone hydrolase
MKPEKPKVDRRIPVPASVSKEAQDYLNEMPSASPDMIWAPPDGSDSEAWHRFIHQQEGLVKDRLQEGIPASGLERAAFDLEDFTIHELRPIDLGDPNTAPIVIDIHGGALVLFGGELSWWGAAPRAVQRRAITWAPDYRLPPEHPYPTPLGDVLTAYRHALEWRQPNRILVFGESAGGNLAAALMLRLKDERLPLPAALVLFSPQVDLTQSGDTFATNLGIDVIGLLTEATKLYANGHDLADPYLSPLFGDVSGFPPTFLKTGTRDIFLSNVVRMHRKLLNARVPAELRVLEAAPHPGRFSGNSPEDHEVLAEAVAYERHHLGNASP